MIVQKHSTVTTPRVGSINDPESCREAARLINEGYPVGAFVRTTSTIWTDAGNRRGVDSILSIKGPRRVGKPLSLTLNADTLVQMIDFSKVRADLWPVLRDPAELSARLALLCLLRLPLTESAAQSLPEVVVSETPDGTRWMQNCVTGNSRGDFPLVQAMLDLGISLPSVTSMNVSGEPEIVDQHEALAFCATHGIPLFLADPGAKPAAIGSYPIISVGPDGVKLLRRGHFPAYLFQYLLQTQVDTSQAAPAKYPIYVTHCERCASTMQPHELHDEMMTILQGSELS